MTKTFNNVGILDLRDNKNLNEEIKIENAGIVVVNRNDILPESIKIKNIGNLIKSDQNLSIIKSEFILDHDYCLNSDDKISYLVTGTLKINIEEDKLFLIDRVLDKVYNFGKIVCENKASVDLIKKYIEISSGDIIDLSSKDIVLNGRVKINNMFLNKYKDQKNIVINGIAECHSEKLLDLSNNINAKIKVNGRLIISGENMNILKENITSNDNYDVLIIPDNFIYFENQFFIDKDYLINFDNKNIFFPQTIMFDEKICIEDLNKIGNMIFNENIFIKKDIYNAIQHKIKCNDVIFYDEAINLDGYREVESVSFFNSFSGKKDLFVTGNVEWGIDYKESEKLFRDKINNVFNFGIINVAKKDCKDLFYSKSKINDGIISHQDNNFEETDIYYLRL